MSEQPTLPTSVPRQDQVIRNTSERTTKSRDFAAMAQYESQFSTGAQHNARVLNSALEQNSQSEVDEHFERWKTEVAPHTQSSEFTPWNLNEDEPTNENLWTNEELETPVSVIERIEEAKPPVSRAEQVMMAFHPLTDDEKRQRFDQLTKAIGSLHPLR